MEKKKLTLLVIIVALFTVAGVVIFVYPALNRSIRTQIVPGIDEEEQILEKKLRLTIPPDAESGTYKFKVGWEDSQDNSLLALSEEITVVVADDDTDGGGDGEGDNGGGDGGGGGEEEVQARPVRTYAFAPHKGHAISGAYSGVREDSGLTVVTLAHEGARLAKKVAVPRDSYWLYVNAKHDKPGPVDMAVYINNKAWKVIRLEKQDNRYRTHRVGLLRNFTGGTIRFRFLNDVYDKADPTNEAKDRNLHIASWGLTTDASRLPLLNTVSKGVGGGATGRVALLPRLNQINREELGRQFVTFDIWKYYAARLTIPSTTRESIRSEAHLRNVMRYWKGVRANRPRGD